MAKVLLCFQYGTGLTEYQDYITINGEEYGSWRSSDFDYVKVFPATYTGDEGPYV